MNTIGSLVFVQKSETDLWEQLIHLDQLYFPQPWSTAGWEEMDLQRHLLIGYQLKGKLIGLALFQFIPGDDMAHLFKIMLIPEARGRGVAQDFWGEIRLELSGRGIKSVYLEVELTNQSAVKFYQKVGFSTIRVLKSYYSNGEDACAMQLFL